MDNNHIITISVCVGFASIIIIGLIIYFYNRYLNRYNYLNIDREKYWEIVISV
jgi:hypothetical protein